MTDEDITPEALAALPECTLCGHRAIRHVLVPPLGLLSGCMVIGCQCPAWGMAGDIEDED